MLKIFTYLPSRDMALKDKTSWKPILCLICLGKTFDMIFFTFCGNFQTLKFARYSCITFRYCIGQTVCLEMFLHFPIECIKHSFIFYSYTTYHRDSTSDFHLLKIDIKYMGYYLYQFLQSFYKS